MSQLVCRCQRKAEACQRLRLHKGPRRREGGGCFGPTRVVDAQRQREPTLVAGSTAGDRDRAENRHLLLPTVLC